MDERKTHYRLFFFLITAILAMVGIIAMLAKIISDFSAKLNTSDDEDYIPDWSDEDSFDIDLSENLGASSDED